MPSADQLTFTTLSGNMTVVRNATASRWTSPQGQASRRRFRNNSLPRWECGPARSSLRATHWPFSTPSRLSETCSRTSRVLQRWILMRSWSRPRGEAVDFVSRFFAPAAGIPEDPVTGSAHCTLVPYWAGRLGKSSLMAKQLSARGGDLVCRLWGDRVLISGSAVEYLRGEIDINL